MRGPWPGMARTIYGDHQRFLDTYFKSYPGKISEVKQYRFQWVCALIVSVNTYMCVCVFLGNFKL